MNASSRCPSFRAIPLGRAPGGCYVTAGASDSGWVRVTALAAVAKRIQSYAGHDSELRSIVAELERDSAEVAAPMAAASLKEMHYQSYAAAKMRMPDGKAFRRSS